MKWLFAVFTNKPSEQGVPNNTYEGGRFAYLENCKYQEWFHLRWKVPYPYLNRYFDSDDGSVVVPWYICLVHIFGTTFMWPLMLIAWATLAFATFSGGHSITTSAAATTEGNPDSDGVALKNLM